jgi:hypothetical protein
VDRGRGLQLSTHRVRVQDLVPYFQENCSHDEILRWIPTLTREEIAVVEQYYRDHKKELDELGQQESNPNEAPPVPGHQAHESKTPKDENSRSQIDAFLEEVYRLAANKDLDGATDRIFDFMDRLLCDGAFGLCDQVLRTVDIEKLPTAQMRSFLSITAAAKQNLPSRPALYRKIEEKMIERRGVEKTRTILGNLA